MYADDGEAVMYAQRLSLLEQGLMHANIYHTAEMTGAAGDACLSTFTVLQGLL